ncbi:MAG: response regulator [Leptolyngbya sp. SIOISBB]|nr:response regulator [Leptolyngbya sp. SIOISBB]
MRILLVDDDEALMETLAESLIRQRYAVDIAANGEIAQEFQDLFPYDLVVLDWLLPDTEGIALCRQFRQQGMTCPILMLTAKDDSADKVRALDAGADDYVVKPFNFEELCARIRALLRRDSPGATSVLQWGELSLNPSTFEVFYGEHQIHTTPKEYALLELFLRHPTQVFSLNAIIDDIWSFEDPPSGDAVRTHIKGLRQKLKAGGAPKNFIETVYGLGYRLHQLDLVDLVDLVEPPPESRDVSEMRPPTTAAMQAAVAQAWETHQEIMQERLQILEAMVTAVQADQLSIDLQQQGRSQAHKLAGSLGCYGFAEGSRIARELERLLELEAPLGDEQASQVAQLVQNLRQSLVESPLAAVEAAIAPTPQLLVVGAEPAYSQALAVAAEAINIRSMVAANLNQAHAMLQAQPPTVVLLCLTEADFEAAMGLLAAIARCSDQIPVLIMTDSHDFQQRLQLVRQGVEHLLPTSTPPQQVMETVQQTLQADDAAFKILVVDDDVQILALLRTLLASWGMQLTTLADPAQLWDSLEQVQPDLLVLDVEMPGANGLELCQALRTDEQWRHLSILFLTVHEDAQTLQQAFNVGADDFIYKSTMVTELPRRILKRLQ